MSQTDNKKDYLRSYELIAQLRNFFSKIGKVALNYEYIVALEPRCFNFVNLYLPQLENLVTGNGLLVQHKKMAEYYKKHGIFPKILIIEDVLIDACNMGKFLYQLEALIEADLGNIDLEKINKFRRCLERAIEIRVYSNWNSVHLLEERYLNKVKSEMTLPLVQIHDLSLQLSDALRWWEIANTSFSYSSRNKNLTDYLCYGNGDVPGWTRILWNYDNEQMIIYIRFNNPTQINQISTIRIFPGRSDKLAPQMTSLTLTNSINGDVFNKICRGLKELLSDASQGEQNCFVALQELLGDTSDIIQQSKAQLIYFLLSVIDYYDFRSSVKKMIPQTAIKSDTDDVTKIACNFGLGKIQEELSKLCASTELLTTIKDMLYIILSSETTPMMCGNAQEGGKKALDNKYAQVNDAVSEIFYVVGVKADESVVKHVGAINRFIPGNYQNYTGFNTQHDGVISFSDFNKIANQEYSKTLSNVYYRIASLISIVDYGVTKLTFQFSKYHNCLYVLFTAGPMANFFGPKQIAIAIPAFAILEHYCHRMDITAKEAIKSFCMERNNEELKKMLNSDEFVQWHQFFPNLITTLQSNVEKYLDMLYSNGMTEAVATWNFKNITYKRDKLWLKYQWLLQKWAMIFLRLE